MPSASEIYPALFVGAIIFWIFGLGIRRTGRTGLADIFGGIGSLLAVGFFVVRYLSGPDAPAQPAAQNTTAKAVFGERLVSENRSAIYDITVDARDPLWSEWFDVVGSDIKELGQWMKSDPSRTPSGPVVVTFRADLKDQYGKISRENVAILRWSKDDWDRIAWDSIGHGQVILLAGLPFLHPAMRKDLISWCAKNEARRGPCAGPGL
ncbi:MAG: hypothetical protein K2Q28_12030 [Hyphomicrobium sp.]|nr:hypothetical protein [Hyphomicrobium sp.]